MQGQEKPIYPHLQRKDSNTNFEREFERTEYRSNGFVALFSKRRTMKLRREKEQTDLIQTDGRSPFAPATNGPDY